MQINAQITRDYVILNLHMKLCCLHVIYTVYMLCLHVIYRSLSLTKQALVLRVCYTLCNSNTSETQSTSVCDTVCTVTRRVMLLCRPRPMAKYCKFGRRAAELLRPSDGNVYVTDPPRMTGVSIRLKSIENPYPQRSIMHAELATAP